MKSPTLYSGLLLVCVTLIGTGLFPSSAKTEALPNTAQNATIQNPDKNSPPATERNLALEQQLADAGLETDVTQQFVSQLRMAALQNDRQTLVNLVRFPFTTYDHGEPTVTYHNAEALLQHFDWVFTARVIKVMQEAHYDRLFVNQDGVMLGDGEVWFDQREDGIKVKAINGWTTDIAASDVSE